MKYLINLEACINFRPENMVGFRIPPGKGLYIHPGTWHNGIYVNRKYSPLTVGYMMKIFHMYSLTRDTPSNILYKMMEPLE